MSEEGDDPEPWVLASEIPFAELKGHRLEECLYWLLDGLGAKRLEWRVGGVGGGAADGGRDVVASFYTPDVEGRMQEQRWWIECKGRAGTLEKEAVVNACNNVTAYAGVDHLVIATNTQFSNPTRDWVKEWQAHHPSPKVLLWDRAELERMLSRQPATVLRLFREALSLSGRLEAVRERYFSLMEYSSIDHIKAIWSDRETLEIGPLERIALVVNEFAHGDIDARPWCGGDDKAAAVGSLSLLLFNFWFLYSKWMKAGVDQGPLVASAAYLFGSALRHCEPDEIWDLVDIALRVDPEVPMPAAGREYFLGPIFDHLLSDLTLACSGNCPRFYRADSVKAWLPIAPIDRYWARYGSNGDQTADPQLGSRLENTSVPCVIGLTIAPGGSCRLYEIDPEFERGGKFLSVLSHVMRHRTQKPRYAESPRE
jgi:hypothetical protein